MLLEKLKQHGGKIMFFVMNILVVAAGVLIVRQKNTEDLVAVIAENDAIRYKAAVDYALTAQQNIANNQQNKIDSIIANRPDTIQKEQIVTVTKTIPAVTRTVTVQQPVSNTISPAKATTKKS